MDVCAGPSRFLHPSFYNSFIAIVLKNRKRGSSPLSRHFFRQSSVKKICVFFIFQTCFFLPFSVYEDYTFPRFFRGAGQPGKDRRKVKKRNQERTQRMRMTKVPTDGFSMDREKDEKGILSVATRRVTTEKAPFSDFRETRKDKSGLLSCTSVWTALLSAPPVCRVRGPGFPVPQKHGPLFTA